MANGLVAVSGLMPAKAKAPRIITSAPGFEMVMANPCSASLNRSRVGMVRVFFLFCWRNCLTGLLMARCTPKKVMMTPPIRMTQMRLRSRNSLTNESEKSATME